MAGMPYPPINTSAPTDADVCADRCGCLRRPMRMSASTDADVCTDRCAPLGGALVSARLCRLPEQEVHQLSKNVNYRKEFGALDSFVGYLTALLGT